MTEQAERRLLEKLRPTAFAIGYRMLGSVSEAEDIAQETLLRVHRALGRGEALDSPRAYAATVSTRLAIDALRSARVRRETYVGEWLPEPLMTGPDEDPAARAELADTLSMAFLVLLESLSPEQRAAFLLREVFDYGYGEIAAIIGTSEQNARQLATRARRHVEARRPRFEPSRDEREALADRFFAAARDGRLAELEALLAEDVELHGDGGGKVPALARVLRGRQRVARTLRNWGRQGAKAGGVAVRRVELNGQPGGLFLLSNGELVGAMVLDIADGRVRSVRSIANPDKLRHLGPVGDVVRALKGIAGAPSSDRHNFT